MYYNTCYSIQIICYLGKVYSIYVLFHRLYVFIYACLVKLEKQLRRKYCGTVSFVSRLVNVNNVKYLCLHTLKESLFKSADSLNILLYYFGIFAIPLQHARETWNHSTREVNKIRDMDMEKTGHMFSRDMGLTGNQHSSKICICKCHDYTYYIFLYDLKKLNKLFSNTFQ